MRKVVALVGITIGFAMVGCSNNTEQLDAFKIENEELRAQYTEAQEALQAADSDLQRAQEELRAEQERNGTLQTQLDTRPEVINVFENIDGVNAAMRDKDLALTVASDLLFTSGSATLKKAAKSTLTEVADSLNSQYPDQSIVVMGYTDTDKIKKSNFKSNWHLAFDRAWAVRDYLVSKGVNQNRISIESWGPTKPLATKAASRRVDIVVVDD
ncbi:MAG: OmpA family protein [Phycisphaerales bacterium]|nr:OmpA family protein [Phycisphaerales bacterium]